ADIVAEQIEKDLTERSQRDAIEDRIDQALRPGGMRSVFQPIHQAAENRIAGFEALSRFDPAVGRAPDIWFNEAATAGRGVEFEQHAIKLALEALNTLPSDIYLSVNASPEVIVNGDLASVFRGYPIDRIVLEVTEHEDVDQYTEIAKII